MVAHQYDASLQRRNGKPDIDMKDKSTPEPEDDVDAGEGKQTALPKKKKNRKLFTVKFFYNWCKSCGLCSALCVKKIIKTDSTGLPYIDEMDSCTGCRFCEIHCPDFAITIADRHPERRRSNGEK